jgi:hypothetical protein
MERKAWWGVVLDTIAATVVLCRAGYQDMAAADEQCERSA